MSPSQIDFLKHIQQELHFLVNHSKDVTFEKFLDDDLINRAYIRSLEIIGEADKKVPDEIRYKYNEVDWRGMTGLRDVLIHQYFQVDYQVVWDVIQNIVPLANNWIDQIVEQEETNLL
ncbi:MAG: HepT-like ribonuclease domain-containing protein [Dyadobacter sp.]|uniref:HepT-like ribonuclease domain-containing protein n=1 Tax=Dyadobacter sp. TaxID=1914288 RepID=UPI003265280E